MVEFIIDLMTLGIGSYVGYSVVKIRGEMDRRRRIEEEYQETVLELKSEEEEIDETLTKMIEHLDNLK